jgi:NADH-quinone oxidoreductase subunit H
MLIIIFVFMWVRWSLPRFRFDQVMDLAWRALIPISLALAVATAVLVWLTGGTTLDGVDGKNALVFLAMNIAVLFLTLLASKLLPAAPATNRRLKIAGSRFATVHAN